MGMQMLIIIFFFTGSGSFGKSNTLHGSKTNWVFRLIAWGRSNDDMDFSLRDRILSN